MPDNMQMYGAGGAQKASDPRPRWHGLDDMGDRYESAPHQDLDWFGHACEFTGLAKAESMDLANDPRFFQDNVINYRVAAFSGLSVVSGLMVQNAFDRAFDMKKRMGIWNAEGEVDLNYILQFIAFALLVYIIFANMLSTYIGVVQPYHTVRLMTGGAMGFEMSASYYLNQSITIWRHFAIRNMLISVPIFAVSTGLRMIVKFDWDNMGEEEEPTQAHGPLTEGRDLGIFFGGAFLVYGFFLYYVHWKHFAVFNDRYATLMTPPEVTTIMTNRMTQRATFGVGVGDDTFYV